jgi:hypothetical protein
MSKIWGQFINENKKPGGLKGLAIRYGRYILHFGYESQVEWSWSFFKHSFCHIGMTVSCDHGVTFKLAFPYLFSFFFSVCLGKRMREFSHKWDWYALYVTIHNWTIWMKAWTNDSETNFKDPWWKRREFSFCIPDFFLGRDTHSRRDLHTDVKVMVPMPEKSYPAKVTIFESTWKRPRWPFRKRMVRSEVDMIEPIPFPGKGENSWDCGEDATYSLTCPETTVEDAVASLVRGTLKRRRKYGGEDWRPTV